MTPGQAVADRHVSEYRLRFEVRADAIERTLSWRLVLGHRTFRSRNVTINGTTTVLKRCYLFVKSIASEKLTTPESSLGIDLSIVESCSVSIGVD